MGVYGPAIAGINLIILISSTVLIYFGNILINFYLIDSLDFVSSNFSALPNLMLAVGVLGLLGGIFGVVVGATSHRAGLIVHAVFVSLIFILQLASIFVTAEVRSQLQHNILNQMTFDLYDVTTQYWTQPDFKERWDEVQRTYACCGFNAFNTGYQDWKGASLIHSDRSSYDYPLLVERKIDSIPDSCCLQETEDCGEGQLVSLKAHLEVYTHGCLAVLEQRMARDIQPVLNAYLGCGVALALLQIIAIVLSSAYSAALNRRKRRENEKYSSVRG